MTMDLKALKLFSSNTEHIAGWFSFHDLAVFDVILSSQTSAGRTGNLLEIGVFAGKSAVLLGHHLHETEEFHVCDIFDEPTDDRNAEEITHSYPDLSRLVFESNYSDFIGTLPFVHQCPSSNLPQILGNKRFRFIHVDGSHLYEHATSDLKYSTKVLLGEYGVIAVDDFRAQHTVGVALAVWEKVIKGDLIPLILTPAKIYLAKPDSKINIEAIKTSLEALGIQCVYEEILRHRVVRTVGLSDSDLYAKEKKVIAYIPPIALDFLRNSYFLKKLRNR